MEDSNITEAEQEAKRFLKRVKEYKAAGKPNYTWLPSKERAAVKRSSMDLTRALSKMRRG